MELFLTSCKKVNLQATYPKNALKQFLFLVLIVFGKDPPAALVGGGYLIKL